MARNGRLAGDRGGEEKETSGQPLESEDLNSRVRCDYCGNALRRLARQGFLQKKVFSKFGFYPWECPLCREPMLVKQQHRLKERVKGEPDAGVRGPARSGAS